MWREFKKSLCYPCSTYFYLNKEKRVMPILPKYIVVRVSYLTIILTLTIIIRREHRSRQLQGCGKIKR